MCLLAKHSRCMQYGRALAYLFVCTTRVLCVYWASCNVVASVCACQVCWYSMQRGRGTHGQDMPKLR
jgi:hypothetical protein